MSQVWTSLKNYKLPAIVGLGSLAFLKLANKLRLSLKKARKLKEVHADAIRQA